MAALAHSLRLKHLGICTYKEAVVYIRRDNYICRSEGFEARSRIRITYKDKSIIATLNIVTSNLLRLDEAGLSEYAWSELGANEGDLIGLSHAEQLTSMDFVRCKIYGEVFSKCQLETIVKDIVAGKLSDIEISSFLTACVGDNLSFKEVSYLTQAMLDVGSRINWGKDLIVDKHCVGGIPGNRTTPIVVPIVAAFGLTIPKTSSRAITSPAGTADVMATLTQVDLDFATVKKVVEKENACIVWGDAAALSPADDILIHVERVLNLDSRNQMVASVLSKKVAAGSTHVLIDVPMGPHAKVKTLRGKAILTKLLQYTSERLGIVVKTIFTDGTLPVGHGIGPALEAFDVLAVLQNSKDAPQDLRERALTLAGGVLEFSPHVRKKSGRKIAEELLTSGQAWRKFQSICMAQGGLFEPPRAKYTRTYGASKAGKIVGVDCKRVAKLAKLAGAPNAKAAGVYLQAAIGERVEWGQPLLTVHAESPVELDYAFNYLQANESIMHIF